MHELMLKLLQLERTARSMQYEYDNKYAAAHLEEIRLLLKLALVQVKYAELAHKGLDQSPDPFLCPVSGVHTDYDHSQIKGLD